MSLILELQEGLLSVPELASIYSSSVHGTGSSSSKNCEARSPIQQRHNTRNEALNSDSNPTDGSTQCGYSSNLSFSVVQATPSGRSNVAKGCETVSGDGASVTGSATGSRDMQLDLSRADLVFTEVKAQDDVTEKRVRQENIKEEGVKEEEEDIDQGVGLPIIDADGNLITSDGLKISLSQASQAGLSSTETVAAEDGDSCRITAVTFALKPHPCRKCSRRFSSLEALTAHVASVHLRRYLCEFCSHVSKSAGNLKSHVLTHTGERPYRCDICEKFFPLKSRLKTHARIHSGEKPYACSHCPARFVVKHALTSHTRTHTQERPYECHICSKRFLQLSHMTTHVRIHSDRRPHVCDVCAAAFKQLHQLQRHVRAVHDKDKPFKCHLCPAAFISQAALNIHTKTHVGKRRFQCGDCTASFDVAGVLKKHCRIHAGEKKYKCDVCGVGYAQKDKFMKHKKSHRKKTQFTCDLCSLVFISAYRLKVHKLNHPEDQSFKCQDCSLTFKKSRELRYHKRKPCNKTS